MLLKQHFNRYILHFIELNNHNNQCHPNHNRLVGQGGSLLAFIRELPSEDTGLETENSKLVSVNSSSKILGQCH